MVFVTRFHSVYQKYVLQSAREALIYGPLFKIIPRVLVVMTGQLNFCSRVDTDQLDDVRSLSFVSLCNINQNNTLWCVYRCRFILSTLVLNFNCVGPNEHLD